MTLQDAIYQGYKLGENKYFRGYVSRKIDIYKQPVKVAGGNRKGQLYIEAPNFGSTRFSLRIYLTK